MDARRRDDGFNLVELLVVVMVIGLLAGIAIPVLIGQRQHAYEVAMTSDLRNAVTAEVAFSTSNDGAFTAATSDLVSEGYRASHDVTPVHVRLVGASYVACVRHQAVSTWLVYDAATGSTRHSSADCAP